MRIETAGIVSSRRVAKKTSFSRERNLNIFGDGDSLSLLVNYNDKVDPLETRMKTYEWTSCFKRCYLGKNKEAHNYSTLILKIFIDFFFHLFHC